MGNQKETDQANQSHNEQPNHGNQSWFLRLQSESWYLEMVLSGIAIFLLFQAPDFIKLQAVKLVLSSTSYIANTIFLLYPIVQTTVSILLIGLMIHLVLRAFWIGVVGISSVFPAGVRYEQLRLSEVFQEKLQRKIPGSQRFILLLDHICSSIYGIAMYIVLLLLGFSVWLIVSFWLLYGLTSITNAGLIILIPAFIYLGLSLFYFFDFVSGGLLKRMPYASRFYYYLYVFFGWLTLAFVYRPIYYIFLSNVSRKVISTTLVTAIVLLLLSINFTYVNYPRFPTFQTTEKVISGHLSSQLSVNNSMYDNLRQNDQLIYFVSIQSDMITDQYVRLFIPVTKLGHHSSLDAFCADSTKVLKKGLSPQWFDFDIDWFGFSFEIFPMEHQIKDFKSSLDCLERFWQISVNDSTYQTDFSFYQHPETEQIGLLTYIPTSKLPDGKNILEVKYQYYNGTSFTEAVYARVPFWLSNTPSKRRTQPSPSAKKNNEKQRFPKGP